MPENIKAPPYLREAPEYLEQASRWFSEQWGIAQTE